MKPTRVFGGGFALSLLPSLSQASSFTTPLQCSSTFLNELNLTNTVLQGVLRYGLKSPLLGSLTQKRDPGLLGALGGVVGGLTGTLGGLVGGLLGTVVMLLDGVIEVIDPGWGVTVQMSTNDNYDNAYYTTMYLGADSQPFKLNIDTGSADLFIYSYNCTSCPLSDHSSFNPTTSKSFKSPSSVPTFNITYQDGTSISGYTGKDTVALANGINVEGQYVNLATKAIGHWATDGFDGIVGMGPDILAYVPNTTTVLSSLVKNGKLNQPLLGIALVGWKESQCGGEYDFGAVNPIYIAGILDYVPVSSSIFWGVNLTGISMGRQSVMSPTDAPRVMFDTGTTLIYVSDAEAAAIHKLIPGSSSSRGFWTVPCNTSYPTTPNLFFRIGGSIWGVPAADLAFYQTGDGATCLSGVQGGSNNFVVLGDVFLKNHYVVFNYGNTQGTAKSVGIANRTDISPIL